MKGLVLSLLFIAACTTVDTDPTVGPPVTPGITGHMVVPPSGPHNPQTLSIPASVGMGLPHVTPEYDITGNVFEVAYVSSIVDPYSNDWVFNYTVPITLPIHKHITGVHITVQHDDTNGLYMTADVYKNFWAVPPTNPHDVTTEVTPKNQWIAGAATKPSGSYQQLNITGLDEEIEPHTNFVILLMASRGGVVRYWGSEVDYDDGP